MGKEQLHRRDCCAFISSLQACAQRKDLHRGIKLHGGIRKLGVLQNSPYLATALISMYAKCGAFSRAERVLSELPIGNAVPWNALISGYAQQGHSREALICFGKMQQEGIPPDAFTFTSILKACGSIAAVEEGQAIHKEIVEKGLLEKDIVLGTALVDMYARCDLLERALQALEALPRRNVFTWASLISGYSRRGQGQKALNCFECMRSEGLDPDVVTLICALNACGQIRAVERGEEIHREVSKRGLLEKDIVLGNALVDMYAKCGLLSKAQQVLQDLPVRDVVSWNTLIAAYAHAGQGHEALNCFDRMQREGFSPDNITFPSVLKSCGSIGAVDKGKQIHLEILNKGLLDKNAALGNALVDMYAKCSMLGEAWKLLEEFPCRSLIAWNALISGYVEQGQAHEALKCFEEMQREGIVPDAVIFTSLLKACGSSGAIDKGEEIHDQIVSKGLLEKDIVLGTVLVEMYAKCGMLEKAQEVLEDLSVRDVVCWSVLIAGYAQKGQGHKALECFKRMQSEGLSPDRVTFLCVLNACCHSGLLNEAQMLHRDMMIGRHGLIPNVEHHACMVMLYAYAGDFDKAMSVIMVMPSLDQPPLWLVLLGACRKWENVRLARSAFVKVIELDNDCAAAYFLMASIYTAAGMHKDAENVKSMRPSSVAMYDQRDSMWRDASGTIPLLFVANHSRCKHRSSKPETIALKISQGT